MAEPFKPHEFQPERAEAYFRYWHLNIATHASLRRRYLEQVALWQGKYAMVKHENTKLRQQLRKLREARG